MAAIRYGLEDKVAVVTGGSRGIGFEIARELLAQDAYVVICGRKQEGLDAAVARLASDRLIAFQAHIAREEEVEGLFAKISEAHPRIDILVNNVGMNLMTPAIPDTDFGVWQKILETNLNGTYLVSRAASRLMRQAGSGAIVNVSSIAGRKASPAMGIYGIAKAGVEMLTKVMASELAGHGIRVNAVAPAMVRTDFSKPFWSNPELHAHITRTIPMGRIAEPIEVVHPVLFLASSASAFITGQTILVDGGATAI
ncbi:MAG TPA: SDR family oxidoreductase [Deltaproteobacteria bacterium]|nr:SDR family oxidoreductase [Deltaproteobacteria bacterium]HOI06209.1 SDR family oxidoreductase [Deltaproteobacteria bacterium]